MLHLVRLKRWRGAAIAVLSVALALVCARQAALAHFRALVAPSIPAVLAADPELQVAANDYRFIVDAERLRPEAARRSQIARAALARSPFNPTAMRQLGLLADLEPATKAGGRYFAVAEGMTRRDLANQMALIGHAIERQDIPAILRHYDRALRVFPNVNAALFPSLVNASSDPRVRAELRRFAGSPWFVAFLGQLIQSDNAPQALGEFLTQLRPQLPVKAGDHLASMLLVRLLETSQYGAARDWISRASPARAAMLDRLGFDTGTTDPAFGALAWSFDESDAIAIALTKAGTLEIQLAAGRHEIVAKRMTILPPGNYSFRQTLSHEASKPNARVTWSLRCLTPAIQPSLWSLETANGTGAQRLDSRIEIPRGCLAQAWTLSAASSGTGEPASAWITDLTLSKLM